MESGTISGIEYPVFDNMDEYQEYHMERSGVVPVVQSDWRNAKKGDWVLSDDPDVKESRFDYQRIVQLLYQKDLKHKIPSNLRTKGSCRTIVGSFVQCSIFKMDTDLSIRTYPRGRYMFFINSKPLKNVDRIAQRERLTRNEILFCLRVSTGADPIKIYEEIYKSKSFYSTRNKTFLLLKQDRIMNKITEDLGKVREDMGVDHRFVLGKLLELLKKSKDEEFKLKVVDKLGEISGTYGEKQRITTTFTAGGVFSGFTPQQIQEAEMEQLPSGKDDDGS